MLMPVSEHAANLAVGDESKNKALFPIEAVGLSFVSSGKRIIDDVAFTFEDVPCSVIVGHNGAGKSILLRLLHGLLKPTSGSIKWGSSSNEGALRQLQAMVFQKPLLLRRSVAANLHYVLRRRGLRGQELKNSVTEFLKLADLLPAQNRAASVLSGGEAQRLAIARALATNPSVLLLDEPTASLDPKARAAVEQLLRQIMQRGIRVILVTQDIGQAERLADRILVMHEGRIVEHGTAKQILENTNSMEGRAFFQHKI